MSLGLHPNCLQRLSEEIAEQLPWLMVKNNMFLESWATVHLRQAESILPQTGLVKGKLEQYISDQPVSDFVWENNELLSFVKTVVAMEILLGDKTVSDLMGLGELLRNRCAYLIGNSQKEREAILKDFKEIYEVRCKIVHRGKSRLTEYERNLFYNLRQTCHSVIREEIILLQKDIDKPPHSLLGSIRIKP